MRQWVLKITDYADRLLDDIDKLTEWEPSIKEMQRNWIGRSDGAKIKFSLCRSRTDAYDSSIVPQRVDGGCGAIMQTSDNGNKPNEPDDRGLHLRSTAPPNSGGDYGAVKYIEVFTTRPDTLFGATYMVIAPEHEILKNQKSKIKNLPEVEAYVEQAKKKSELERSELQKEKSGVELKGIKAINPVNGEEIPVFVADYVLSGYGTGAIMAVPAHDERDWEFAMKYGLKIREVVCNLDDRSIVPQRVDGGCGAKMQTPDNHYKPNETVDRGSHLRSTASPNSGEDYGAVNCYSGEGVNINSGFLDGLHTKGAKEKMIQWLEEHKVGQRAVNYKLKDWVFSRQRYWGEPIPLVCCEACRQTALDYIEENKIDIEALKREVISNEIANAPTSAFGHSSREENAPAPSRSVPAHPSREGTLTIGELLNPGWVPVEDLPVELPEVESYEPTGTGESPLANIADWVNRACPKCGGPAKRETNTMPQWAGSSWYYLRYIDPKNDQALVDKDKEKYWSPVDLYVGGAEHATRHLIYARFWHKFLFDIGAVSCDEPFTRLQHVGLILAEDGRKMSKRWGNVINPDEIVEKYGADAMRVYEMFMGPFAQACAWNTNGLIGARRFLERIYKMKDKIRKRGAGSRELGVGITTHFSPLTTHYLRHKTIKKVTEDIGEFKFNTAVAALMILVNEMEKEEEISIEQYSTLIKLLAPFAPHLCEEIYAEIREQGAGSGELEIPTHDSRLTTHITSIFDEAWPDYDPSLVIDDTIELVLQVNGKVRDRVSAAADISEEDAKKLALESEIIKKWLEGKEPKKVVYVKGKLVNIVI
jgi:leucyl-tRNA synthetase